MANWKGSSIKIKSKIFLVFTKYLLSIMSRGIKYGSYLKMLVIQLTANTHRAMKDRKQITEHKIR